jgi:hypothetical protein
MVKATPDTDFESKTFEFNGETYAVKNKFKIFKFFKALNDNPVSAIALALEDESIERLEELEIDMEDFKEILENISSALAGTSSGN